MSVLNFQPSKPSRGRMPLKVILGVGFLAAVVAMASTLAANININTGPVEFGQGIAMTTSCTGSDHILVTPLSTFSNSGENLFYLSKVTVADIPSSCIGKDFLISAYPETSSALALDGAGATVANVYFDGASTDSVVAGKSASATFAGSITSATSTSFTLSFSDSTAVTTDIYKITIETQAHDGSAVVSAGDAGLLWKTFLFTEADDLAYADPSSSGPAMSESGRTLCDLGIDSQINNNFNGGGANSSCGGDNYLDHFTGSITIPGTYDGSTTALIHFWSSNDDGFQVTIGGTAVIDENWRPQGAYGDLNTSFADFNASGSGVFLVGQTYSFDAWHSQGNRGSIAQLGWDALGTPAIIATQYFSHTVTPMELALSRCVTNIDGEFTMYDILNALSFPNITDADAALTANELYVHIAGFDGEASSGGMVYDNSGIQDLFCGNNQVNELFGLDSAQQDRGASTDVFLRDVFFGGAGNDSIENMWGSIAYGGPGDDVVTTMNEDSYFNGGEGTDSYVNLDPGGSYFSGTFQLAVFVQ